MRSKLIKFELIAHVLILNDEDQAIDELKTISVNIYRGSNLDYEEFIREIERVTLQKFEDGRSREDR